MRCARKVARRGLLLVGVVVALTAAPAYAGTYPVIGGCDWSPSNSHPGNITVFGDCGSLTARHVRGAFSTPLGAVGHWTFYAPSGTTLGAVQMEGVVNGSGGWESTVFTETGSVLAACPGAGCPRSFTLSTGALGSTQLILRIRCSFSSPCSNHDPLKGAVYAQNIVVNIQDGTSPGVGVTGGDLLSGWRRGTGSVSVAASDNVGIKIDRLLVDGSVREQRVRSCNWTVRVPCPNGAAQLSLDTTRVSDGQHTLSVQAVDSADNVGGQSHTVLVDNTAPAAPLGTELAGGSTWRAGNAFSLSWRNPAQVHAPIATVRYRLCPLANAPADATGCVGGQRSATNISGIPDLTAPAPGAWRAQLWLVDAAGNEDARTAVESVLRFDNEPPTVAFREQTAEDPARLRVVARDATSAVSEVRVEVRRRGDEAWTELSTQNDGNDRVAFMDDETLPAGTYDLRAHAVDLAGNERTTQGRVNGQPAVLELPVRSAASIRVGLSTRRCTKARKRPRCSTRLVATPTLDYGRKVALHGELRIGEKPSPGRLDVWRQMKAPGAVWEHAGSVEASATGRFRFLVPPGPARLYRFGYAGAPTARGATEIVDAQVRAATTFKPSRRNVVNGEYITFRGRLKGGHIPPGGKLVELQVFTRRRWRTFAQPRASATTGRWSFQYRFEAVRGRARFRFRARVRREASYPFHSGTSRDVAVTVHGI